MSYWPLSKVSWDTDSLSVDAYGHARVSQPVTLFDGKQLGDDRNIYFDAAFTLGATGSYSKFRSSTTLSVSSTSGSQAIRQSKPRANLGWKWSG